MVWITMVGHGLDAENSPFSDAFSSPFDHNSSVAKSTTPSRDSPPGFLRAAGIHKLDPGLAWKSDVMVTRDTVYECGLLWISTIDY